MKKIIILTAASFLVILGFQTSRANAIGISVRPSELRIQAQTGETASARIKVKNPSEEVALFEVYPEEFENKISASPAKFTLESGEEKDVVIKFKPSEDGIFSTSLAVVARPLDNPGGIGSGAKIAFQAENKPRSIGLALISDIFSGRRAAVAIIILAALATLMLILRKRIAQKQN